MARHARTVIEYRNYDLPAHFPLLHLTGERWHISDIPSGVLHFHNCLELGLCQSGSGILGFEDAEFPFSAGDVTVIAGDVPHTTYSAPGTASKWSYLFMDAEELLRPFFPLNALPNSALFRELLHDYRNILPPAQVPGVRPLFDQILAELEDKQLNYEVGVRGLFLALMTELMRVRPNLQATAAQSSMPIAPALEQITARYMENFSMEDLAALCHMSCSHFRRVFGEIMGIGPLEHLNRTRILKACALLRMTEQSILEISEQVGFRSLSSFNRHFSAVIGASPTGWRRQMSANKNHSILKYSGWL